MWVLNSNKHGFVCEIQYECIEFNANLQLLGIDSSTTSQQYETMPNKGEEIRIKYSFAVSTSTRPQHSLQPEQPSFALIIEPH